MPSFKSTLLKVLPGLAMAFALALGGCDSDDVTGPTESRTSPPPTSATNNSQWSINVTASPNEVNINQTATGSSEILVSARRADNNSQVPVGTTALLTTTSGSLSTPEGQVGNSVPIVFDAAGQARASLVTGTFANAGQVIVRAQIQSSFGQAVIRMIEVEVPPFLLTTVTPSFGPPSGGTNVTINGSGFVGPVQVFFDGQPAVARVAGSTRISARTPAIDLEAGQSRLVSVSVTNAVGSTNPQVPTASQTLPNAFRYTRSASPTRLQILSLSPRSGPNEGGTRVTIRGEGFGQEAQVFFGDTSTLTVEATVLSITSTEIVALTPPAIGQNAGNQDTLVPVEVLDPSSGERDVFAAAFQYGSPSAPILITSVAPNQVEYLGGDSVTIFGTGFDEPVAVEAGLIAQQVTAVSGTEILFRSVGANIGCTQVSGPVRVTNIETGRSATGPNFSYVPIRPRLLGVTGSGGDNVGRSGEVVTVTGSPRSFGIGFDPPVRVTFGGTPVSNPTVSNNGTTITVRVPEFSGDFPQEVCCTLADGTEITGNTFAFVDVTAVNLPTTCSDTFAGAWGYIPPNNTCSDRIAAGDCASSGGGGGGGGGTQ